MGNIISKLNLNKTPNIVENNSLVFAKNIRLDVDDTIHEDYGILPLSFRKSYNDNSNPLTYNDDLLNRIMHDINHIRPKTDGNNDTTNSLNKAYTYFYNILKHIKDECKDFSYTNDDNKIVERKSTKSIVGVIANVNEFYLFLHGRYIDTIQDTNKHVEVSKSCIVKYDESSDLFDICNCNWSYSGGTITGYVINNLVGNKLLIIGESGITKLVPLKCINLSTSSYTDNESVYTQTPKIPITNINCDSYFTWTIPNGVYQFFVRYKIKNNHYTNWFPASRELFAGNIYNEITNFGSLKYTNINTDAHNSFVLTVEHLILQNTSSFESFQLGFILSHDDAVYARAWKHFTFNENTINFDYVAEDAKEIEITELTKPVFNLYNVGNITNFKNKLYISNYTETDFNENLSDKIEGITINIKTTTNNQGYAGNSVQTTKINNKDFISSIYINENWVDISGENGIIHQLIETPGINNTKSLKYILTNIKETAPQNSATKYDFRISTEGERLQSSQDNIRRNLYKETSNIVLDSVKFTSDDVIKCVANSTDVIYDKYAIPTKPSQYNPDDVISYVYDIIKFLGFDASFKDLNGNTKSNITLEFYRNYTYSTYEYGFDEDRDDRFPIGNDNINDDVNDDIFVDPNAPIAPDIQNPVVIKRSGVYIQKIFIQFTAYANKIQLDNINNYIKYTTLIPYQTYNFYIHYIKDTGEITNGYFVEQKTIEYQKEASNIIYPVFENIPHIEGYVGCFFSIYNVSTKVATVFNIKTITNDSKEVIAQEGSCLELNTRLMNGKDNIQIKQGSKNSSFNYYYSSDASSIRYFGADGVCDIFNTDLDDDNLAYAIFNYSTQQDDIDLIKCTPFIITNPNKDADGNPITVTYDNYTTLNLKGYLCAVTMLDRDTCISYYSDKSTVYEKQSKINTTEQQIELKELGTYSNSVPSIINLPIKTTESKNIYSNFNFNYVSITDKPVDKIITYHNYSETATPTTTDLTQYFLKLVASLTLSDIYYLHSMYKSYPTKVYSVYKNDEKSRYDNTIRSSKLSGDEENISVFVFDANDYYNIPTNRGIITNLISVGDVILVHTKDSMFAFKGSNNITSTDGEIQLNESQPFDVGVSEVFGSDFGFAGLQNKTDCITTEVGYVFFDRDTKNIYMYSGQAQIEKISDKIEKLFRRKEIKNVYFANDYYNNRLFISILFEDGCPVTLSFSITNNEKKFISLHDFYFTKAFNTKSICYFITKDKLDICKINKDKNYFGIYYKLEIDSDEIYPQIKNDKVLNLIDYNQSTKTISVKKHDSIIDIIINENYENIKILNSITWFSKLIYEEFGFVDMNDLVLTKMTESYKNLDDEHEIPCDSIMVYSDTCTSNKIDFNGNISNTKPINTVDSYKYPRFNQGVWSFNYFRDIENTKDLGKYLENNRYDDKRTGAIYRSDNNSLIKGKYFVVRFFFKNSFKLETLSLNYNTEL